MYNNNNNNNQYYGPPVQNDRSSYYNYQNYLTPAPPSFNPYFGPPPGLQYQNQNSNSNFSPISHLQQQHQQQWRNNKRPHEYMSSSSSSNGPKPKRQFQKRYGHESVRHQRPIDNHQQAQPNQFRNNFPLAAFQTQQAIYNPPQQQNSLQFAKKQPQGQWLKKVKQEHPVVRVQEDRKQEWSEKMSTALNLLIGCRAGEEVQILLSYLQPSRTDWFKAKEDIHNDLIKFLSPLGVEKVLVFGSSHTGLDFYGSDLDFYVQLHAHPVTEEETRIVISKASKLTRTSPGSDFMIICTIQKARVPLIRLLHRKSKISCDVNFTSKFGFNNSYFLGHVVNFDKRIKELAVVLKIWAKSCKLASNMIITNYCLMMLMIFYLQNIQEPMLDTIFNNQRNRSAMVLDGKKKWNFYFNDEMNLAHNNHQSLRELLVGFFEYYSKIKPHEEVVSLLLGRLIKRTEFDTHPDLKDSRRLITSCGLPQLKTDSNDLFYVQDAFELNLNIGIKAKKNVDLFFEVIKLSHQKCQEQSDRPFSELLIQLFTDVQLPSVQNKNKEVEGGKKNKAKKKFEIIIHAIPGDLKQCQDILSHRNSSRIYSAEDQQKFFFEHAVEYTQKFLREIYLCSIIPEITQTSSSSALSRKFKVILHVDTVNGRKKINFKDEVAFNNEIMLSQVIATNNVKFDLDVLMIISTKDGGKSVQFEIIDESKAVKSVLQNFGSYFSVNILNALRYFLKKRLENAIIHI